jgi:hypothetical protein
MALTADPTSISGALWGELLERPGLEGGPPEWPGLWWAIAVPARLSMNIKITMSREPNVVTVSSQDLMGTLKTNCIYIRIVNGKRKDKTKILSSYH